MFIITTKDNVVFYITDSVTYNGLGNPVVDGGKASIGIPVNVYEVANDKLPSDLSDTRYKYDGTSFSYNDDYDFVGEATSKRSSLLSETDWTQTLDAPITKECSSAFRTYRQALRDITEQEGYPYTITWPEKPEVVKGTPDPVDTAFNALVGGEQK